MERRGECPYRRKRPSRMQKSLRQPKRPPSAFAFLRLFTAKLFSSGGCVFVRDKGKSGEIRKNVSWRRMSLGRSFLRMVGRTSTSNICPRIDSAEGPFPCRPKFLHVSVLLRDQHRHAGHLAGCRRIWHGGHGDPGRLVGATLRKQAPSLPRSKAHRYDGRFLRCSPSAGAGNGHRPV